MKVLEVGQPLQMHQPGVGDLSADEPEDGEIRQSLQMHQPSVGDLSGGEPEVERFVSPFKCTSPASVT